MGAVDFTSYAWGKTPAEAFNAAVEHAQWEHGHGGYSGTIAEKYSYTLVTLPPRMKATAFRDLTCEAAYYDDGEDAREDLARAEKWLAAKPTGRIREAQAWVRAAKKRVKDAERDQARLARKLGANAALVRSAAAVWNDKWGPAVCVEVTSPAERAKLVGGWHWQAKKRGDRLFMFFGLASS